jgi:hypothetical protein
MEFNPKKPRMETQDIQIEKITMSWSEWYSFSNIAIDQRKSKIKIPPSAGVYEAILTDGCEERLTIGKANNLRHRIRQGLVKGKIPHSSGKRVRLNVKGMDFQNIQVRWAETIRPCAVEEELHKLYKNKFGCLPKYTMKT